MHIDAYFNNFCFPTSGVFLIVEDGILFKGRIRPRELNTSAAGVFTSIIHGVLFNEESSIK